MRRAPTVASVTADLLAAVPPDVRADLTEEDPAAAIEVHFPPVRIKALPVAHLGDDCSTDGFYDSEIEPGRPWILYADDASPERVRFTLLHELGHHLLATSATHLLDDIDRIGHSPEGAKRTEELVCHAFAGNLLVPEALVDSIMAGDQLVPQHVVELHAQSWGSWEAVSVRASERIRG